MRRSHLFFTWLFGAVEEINGANRCPTYLYRWVLATLFGYKVYLHHFVGDDWSLDLHDHPKRFVSIGIKGWYLEQTPVGRRKFSAPWFRTFPANHRHRITTPSKSCWTIVIVGRVTRAWGFWHNGAWIHWRDYVSGSARDIADKRQACGDE